MSKKNINRCKFLNSLGICASPINKNQTQCSKVPINLCYFKQCQEKDKRILVLVNKNNRLEEKLNQTNLLLEGKINQYDAKKLDYQALMQTFCFEVGCKDIIQRERDRYKQALDEISDIARSLYYQSISDPVKREEAIYSIIKIVAEAKELKNEKRN